MVQTADIDNGNILKVCDNLLAGPRNHSRAFIKVLVQQGETHVAKGVNQAEFADADGLRTPLTGFRLVDAFPILA
jgi:hypothetical protein